MNRIASSALLLPMVFAVPATVAQQDDAPVALEEVIVTANRREENLQDVAISVAAFTDEFFKDSGTTDLKQLEQYTPSLKIAPVTDTRSTSIRIRGIGSVGSNAGIDPSVGMFIDGIYQGRAGMSIADLMDIQRVEVLRGPQGTLYGKNTAAGALNIISKAPSEVFEADLQAVFGNYSQQEFRGMVNLPWGDSGHATRLSGYNVQRDGFDDNKTAGGDLNDADKWGAKARTLFALGEYGDILLTLDYSKEDSNCCAPDIIDYEGDGSSIGLPFSLLSETYGIPIPPEDPFDRDIYTNQDFGNKVEVGGVGAEWNMDLDGDYIVTWINAWRTYENESEFDGDFSPFEAVSQSYDVDYDQYSSEFRLTSPVGESLDYVVGLYYFYSDMDTVGMTGFLPDLGALFGYPIATGLLLPGGSVNTDTNNHEATSYAAFGQVNWSFAEQWKLTVGARVTYEEKSREGTQEAEPDSPPGLDAPPIAGPDLVTDDTRSETDVSPTVSLSYFMRDDLMLYASFSQGFKSGGFNQVRTAVGAPTEFDDERSRNYELGWKGTWLDRRLQVNGTVFFVDYDDFQAQGFDGANITVRNAGSLESKGVELDVVYLPIAGLTTGIAVGYNDTEYSDFESGECTAAQVFAVTGGNPFIPPDCIQDLTGEELDNAPKWTVSTFAQLEGNFSGTELGWLGRLEYNYTDEFYMAQDLDESLKNDESHLLNARLGIFGADRKWEVTAWGRNLLDEDYFVIGFDIPVMGGFGGVVAPPRTYGVTLNYHME